MDETKSKQEEKRRRRTKPTPICRETGDHVHYPPTRPTKPTPPPHAPPSILESISRLSPNPKPRYGECRKNQAASAGTTAYDGCGEFVSADPGEDSPDCAACGCHRSFHHREEEPLSGGTILEALKISPSRFRQIFCSPYGEEAEEKTKRIATDRSSEEEAGRGRKRAKTRFTAEQTEEMRSYAEKLGWKVSNESRERVKEFCDGIGVTRRKLRVWMNNHSQANGRRLADEEGVKRFKTKFTADQTERMRSYAEKLTWKVGPEDREETEGFCDEIGVNLNNFMTWMNNHKEERDL